MRLSGIVGAGAVALLFGAGAATAAPTCVANCNAANMACSSSGKDTSVCLRAWHQCKVGCATTSGAAPTLKVTQPKPGTVVIQSKPPAPAKH